MTRLTPEQQALAADPESIALARGIARRMARRMARRCPHEYESIEAAALFGLVLAAAAFDPAAGAKFASFAQHRIRGEVLDAARVLMPKGFRRLSLLAAREEESPRLMSLNKVMHVTDWHTGCRTLTLADIVDNGDEPAEVCADYADFVEGVSRGLPPKYRAVFRAHFMRAGADHREVAREVGCTERRVSQMLTRSLEMVRDDLAGRGM